MTVCDSFTWQSELPAQYGHHGKIPSISILLTRSALRKLSQSTCRHKAFRQQIFSTFPVGIINHKYIHPMDAHRILKKCIRFKGLIAHPFPACIHYKNRTYCQSDIIVKIHCFFLLCSMHLNLFLLMDFDSRVWAGAI